MAVAKGAPKRGALLSIKIHRGRGARRGFYSPRRVPWVMPTLLLATPRARFLAHREHGGPCAEQRDAARSAPRGGSGVPRARRGRP